MDPQISEASDGSGPKPSAQGVYWNYMVERAGRSRPVDELEHSKHWRNMENSKRTM